MRQAPGTPHQPEHRFMTPASRPPLRHKIAALYAFLLALNTGAWLWAICVFRDHPALLGTSLLAWSLGLRHAFDADHIAAIDNVTRKLMQAGQRPLEVGLAFSLGHSTIVVIATMAIAATAASFQGPLERFRDTGALIGTCVSAAFLFAIALFNLLILRSVLRTYRRVRRGEAWSEADLDVLLAGRGLIARLLRPLMRLVTRGWHMYFLGFLFGLGFDTASEIGLLGIAAASATQDLPIWAILVFPALFTAGMTLADTTDSLLMLGAYGWALDDPLRKLRYNLSMTALSVVVAVVVCGIEALSLIGQRLHLEGGVWRAADTLGDQLGLGGFIVAGLFAAGWLASMARFRARSGTPASRTPAGHS